MLMYITALVFIFKRRLRAFHVKNQGQLFSKEFTYYRVAGYKKQEQGITEKHFRKYIWKLSFLFKETFSIRKTLILYKMSQKK